MMHRVAVIEIARLSVFTPSPSIKKVATLVFPRMLGHLKILPPLFNILFI
jgi:hypothetical protein